MSERLLVEFLLSKQFERDFFLGKEVLLTFSQSALSLFFLFLIALCTQKVGEETTADFGRQALMINDQSAVKL